MTTVVTALQALDQLEGELNFNQAQTEAETATRQRLKTGDDSGWSRFAKVIAEQLTTSSTTEEKGD